MAKKQLKGKVVSNKMQKTVVVLVGRMVESRKYKKRFMTHKKYKAHTQEQNCNVGDIVLIEECKPFSKEKNWKVIKKLSEGMLLEPEVPEEVLATDDIIKEEDTEQK